MATCRAGWPFMSLVMSGSSSGGGGVIDSGSGGSGDCRFLWHHSGWCYFWYEDPSSIVALVTTIPHSPVGDQRAAQPLNEGPTLPFLLSSLLWWEAVMVIWL